MSCKCGRHERCECMKPSCAFCTVCGEAEIFTTPIKDKRAWMCEQCNTAHETDSNGETKNLHVIKGAVYCSDAGPRACCRGQHHGELNIKR